MTKKRSSEIFWMKTEKVFGKRSHWRNFLCNVTIFRMDAPVACLGRKKILVTGLYTAVFLYTRNWRSPSIPHLKAAWRFLSHSLTNLSQFLTFIHNVL